MAQQFRPFSANPAKKLGSTCPIIIKHDFPNEDQNYLDEGLITLNSYKKRFRYDESYSKTASQRPMSALMTSALPKSARIRASSSKNWHPSSKAEFINSVMKSIKNREKNEIKPIRKLKTVYFHSILYKVKQQKEDLDEKIRRMDSSKTDFKETDICILANTGAIDYILNLNAKANPQSCSNQLLKNEKKELEEVKESRKILSQAHRPNSSHPNFYNPRKKAEKKPEFLTSQDFYDESNEEFKILGNASRMYARPGSSLVKSSSTNEISSKINGFLSNCNKIKELYDCDQNNQYSKDPELIEIPEVDDNYKSVFQEQSLQVSNEVTKYTNPYKTILNMRTKPQKLFKSSLTKFHDSCLSNSSMRVRAVELLNMNSTPYNQVSYNQIHSLKNPNIHPRFFEKNDNTVGKNMERTEVKELSVSGFSNRVVKIKNLNEESEIEAVKPLYNEAIPEKKLRPATAAIQRPINKENNKILQNKISPKHFIVDGSVFNMFSNESIKKSVNRPQTAVGHSRPILVSEQAAHD